MDPAPLYDGDNLKGGPMNMLDRQLYFSLNVTDDDFLRGQEGLPQWGVHTKYTSSWEVFGNYNIKVKSKDSQKVACMEIRQR